jgi:lysophospholipase L1-like esterase
VPKPTGVLQKRWLAPVLLLALMAVASCSSGSGRPGGTGSVGDSAATNAKFYVSIGDSYAAGYQPTGPNSGGTTRNGFAYQVAATAPGVRLENFGCVGATTTTALHSPGCAASALGPSAAPYSSRSQIAAAVAFLRGHQGHIALVTIILGGDDVLACGLAVNNETGCLQAALATIKTNLSNIATQVRAAVGSSVRIVGLTYPDVLLGQYVTSNPNAKAAATASVTLFRTYLNPMLQSVYRSIQAPFVDVTSDTGAYASPATVSEVAGFGMLPLPVAQVCSLTFMCEYGDVHPRTSGYALIARAVESAYQH